MSTAGYDQGFWDRYFRYYDALEQFEPYREMLDLVARLCEPARGVRILDVGAGTGNLLSRLRAAGATAVALDANDRGLARAASKGPSVPCIRATLDSPLPIRPASFERVTAVNVLYTLSPAAAERCLREVRRVLRPGGRFVFVTPVEGAKPQMVYVESVRRWWREQGPIGAARRMARVIVPTVAILAYNERIRRQGDQGAFRFFREVELREELVRAGFEVGEIGRTYANQAWIGSAVSR
ncbi:MAG: class I SAM-dependent methyltransferase [Deltaproteobacteria bacterium]|nr:class I SAM-dependent methyltransferase [Deltaproteobacteria bacterium]